MTLFEAFGKRLDAFLADSKAPLLVVIAGMNGAGKSTCYRNYLHAALSGHMDEHIDPDAVERALRAEYRGPALTDVEFARMAQREAELLRNSYLDSGRSFSFETVFSDPVGDKVRFLDEACRRGYFVVLLCVCLCSPEKSAERVALRVMRGGHSVPVKSIFERYSRVLDNVKRGVLVANLALLVDNSEDDPDPDGDAYQAFALFERGKPAVYDEPPEWANSTGLTAISL